MSTAQDGTGRVRQKQRTRAALVEAARDLVAAGESPTVEQAAAAAGISRPTAYRYFANQRSLLAAAHPETATDTLLPGDAPDDVEARLDLVLAEFARIVVGTEAQQRTMLRLSLDASGRDDLPLRQGRAIAWIEEALEPLGDLVPPDTRHQLAVAIRSAVGIEALVWLTDVAGLDRSGAVDMMRWSARAMLRATLDGHPPPGVAPPSPG